MVLSADERRRIHRTLSEKLAASQDWLIGRVLGLARERDFTRYTSTLEEAWRLSISGISSSLQVALERREGPVEFGPDDDFQSVPEAAFGVQEARRHRARGVPLGMFGGLLVYYRQAYLDLVDLADAPETERSYARLLVMRFFDLFQLAYVTEWSRHPASDLLAELQHSNRRMTNEKNRFLTIFQNLANPVLVIEADGMVEICNQAAASMLLGPGALPEAYYFAEDPPRLQPPDWLAEGIADLERLGRDEHTFEQAVSTPQGRMVYQVRLQRSQDLSRRFTGLVAICTDITERRHAQEALDEQNRQFALLFERMPTAMAVHEILTDAQGRPVDYRFLSVNPAFEAMTGLRHDEIQGRTLLEVLPQSEPHWIHTYGEVALGGRQVQFEEYSRSLERWFNVLTYSPSPGVFVTLFQDITQRRRAEEERQRFQAQLQHTQKLESLGILAGGIAHDFNNLLVAIMGNADLALMDLSESSPARQSVEGVQTAARRASELCRQLLAYSGKGRFIVEPLDLSHLVQEMSQLLNVFISKKASLRFDLAPTLPCIEGDASQLRQIIMNLLTNASEAIGDRQGSILLRTGVVECEEADLQNLFGAEDLPAGCYVFLEIGDNGCGMDAETRSRIFDPFFTTKFAGRGLGLAAVQGIVRGHRGAIKVYSEPEEGTSFKLLFPACPDLKSTRAATVATPSEWKTQARVLLVDDDPSVLGVGRRLLERMGLEVQTAGDGVQALETLATDCAFDVVVLDMTMPRMSGEEAFREIRRMHPDLTVLMCSGYNEQEAISGLVGRGLAGFVQKPYTLQSLRSGIQKALERSAGRRQGGLGRPEPG